MPNEVIKVLKILCVVITGVQITDEGEMVGEPDGTSFGIGPAPPGAKPAPSSVIQAKKKEKEKRGKSKDRAR